MSTVYREVVAPKRASSISDAKAAWARAVCVVLMRANGAASTAEKGSIRELSALKLRMSSHAVTGLLKGRWRQMTHCQCALLPGSALHCMDSATRSLSFL